MYRKMVISSETTTNGAISVLYHVHGAVLLSQYRVAHGVYDRGVPVANPSGAVVFDDVVRVGTSAVVTANRSFEFVFDVPENQPVEEAVEEISASGVNIAVYNENGVLVCRNAPKAPANSDPTQTVVPGEMTSVPGEEPGEMTSVPGEEPGEMPSETTDESGAMI